MKTPRHVIAAALAQRSLSIGDSRLFGEEIAAYLLAEHRVGELDSILRDILQYRMDNGVVEVNVVSAFKLTDKIREDITTQVDAMYPGPRAIIISHRYDKSVMGGVRLEFANQQLDLSVRSKLNRLKQLTVNT